MLGLFYALSCTLSLRSPVSPYLANGALQGDVQFVKHDDGGFLGEGGNAFVRKAKVPALDPQEADTIYAVKYHQVMQQLATIEFNFAGGARVMTVQYMSRSLRTPRPVLRQPYSPTWLAQCIKEPLS